MSRFIPNYSSQTAILRQLLPKAVGFNWPEKHSKAFQNLKNAIIDRSLAVYDPKSEVSVVTDASPYGLGAVLIQKRPESEPEVVAYASRSLSVTEQKYAHIEKEAVALIWACEWFRMYLIGRRFNPFTDHKPLEAIYGRKFNQGGARIEHWRMRLQCFDYAVKYTLGKKNLADPLSHLCQSNSPQDLPTRTHWLESQICQIAGSAVPVAMSINQVRQASMQDEEITCVCALPPLPRESWPKSLLDYWVVRHELAEYEGVLLRGNHLVTPKVLRAAVLSLGHEGHPGMVCMKRRL